MAIVFKDRVEQRTSTTGLSNLTLTGNLSMRNRFQDAFSNGDELYYVIEDGNGAQWEIGKGTFTSPSTLSRDTVRTNSSGTTTKITLSSNEHRVFAAPDAQYLNDVVAIAASHVGAGGDAQHPDANGTTSGFMTASDFTKLAGIESGATGDQTGAEIKALYEAEANTNAFTDAEQTKLSSIEANATADQTGAEIKAAYEGEADTNAFTDAEKSKLAAINQGLATNDNVQFAKVLVGTSTGDDPLVIAREDNTGALASFERHVDGTGGGNVNFIKSRGTRASPTIVQDGDILGGFSAKGHDGSAYVNGGAIQIVVDGTPGAGDMPTAIQFRPTADGGTTRTTRMIIKPDGKVMIGDAVPAYQLDVAGDGGFENALTIENPASSTGSADEDADVYVVSKQEGDSTVWLNTTDSTDTKNVALVNIGNAGSRGHFQIAQGTNGSVTQSLRMDGSGNILLKSSGTPSGNAKLEVDGVVAVKSYTVATLPTPIAGGIIYVSDETGGATLAFSDGTNWRRVSDRAIVS